MSRGTSFLRFFEPAIDPTLVEDPQRLLDYLNACERLPRLLARRDDRGYSLLHYAAEKNQPNSLKILLINGADPNIRSSIATGEVTSLHLAAANGHLDCLKQLVESGGNPLARDANNRLPRDHAQSNGQDLCLDYLQKQSVERVQQETEDLEQLLQFVYECLQSGELDRLISCESFEKLFPLDTNNSRSTQTAKMTAEENIISRYCNLLNPVSLVSVLNQVTRDIPVSLINATLLHAACHYGNASLVQLLVERFPKLLAMPTNEGYTAVHVAVAYKQLEILQILIDAHINVYRHRSASGAMPAGINRPRIMTMSSDAPSLFAVTNSGHTPLHFCIVLNDSDMICTFLRYHKQLSLSLEEARCGYTALHLAVHRNLTDLVHLLLKHGAQPNTTKSDPNLSMLNESPLAEATFNHNIDMVRLLIQYGAEDRRHEALNQSLSRIDEDSQELIPLLLGSLIKCDENATKHLLHTQSRREGRVRLKMAIVDWSGLNLDTFKSEWIHESLGTCPFFNSQGLNASLCLKYVNHLNVSNNKLRELPIEFFQLPNLTILNASNNQIEALPRVVMVTGPDPSQPMWPCAALSRLNLSKNLLKAIPDFLFELPHLTNLDLSSNHLVVLPMSIWSAPKLSMLNCSHNQIKEIPTNWPDVLNEYQFIDVTPSSPSQASAISSPRSKASSRRVSTDPGGATTGGASYVSDNRQTDESSNETDEALTVDKVRQTRLYDRLNVCNADLTIEWDALEGKEEVFDGLNNLNLSHNEIKQIPPNFPCLCPKLIRLDLSHNGISDLAIPRAVPANLKQVNISHNEILILDSYKSRVDPLPCTNPKVLSCSGGTIYRDPSKQYCSHRSHNHLISLSVLDASHNQIADVKLFSPIIHLSEGPCSRGGKIREADVPLFAALASASGKSQDNVRQLARLACPLLTRLVLHHNQIAEVPPSVCEMSSLNSLDLSHNNIIELRPELGKLGNLWEFPLDGLKLISPPHNIIERGKTKDIIGFLWSLLQRARPYHRMKLMLVGKAGRGKTTLLKKISDKGQRGIQENLFLSRMSAEAKQFQKDLSTVGIVVSDWTYTKKLHSDQTQTGLRNITFMTWDFGGQEEYYATHQCFLSRRSLYIVVWNVLDGRDGVEELKPWLLNIQARAPNSPVIIVGTHLDKVKRSRRREVDENVELINRLYGSGSRLMHRQHGFPTIMHNMVVSCTSGSRINELRDVIFDVACQVKENTVAGRGIGCGRIPEYRLLMDQLVPASYLQLEDSVRNIALLLRLLGKPPVLTYKEFKELVFCDTRTLVSRDVGDRELEQAVRFLHDNGTLLHYDDPLLKELYFVDPQWLSDMLAHIVTVREINPFVKDGIMKIKDFSLLFNDKDFPIRWQREYLRLLTTFEVAVEFKQGKLLIPSHLPEVKPELSQCYPPENTVFLPPLRHTYLLAFVPSGFWPRLMSRVLSDRSIFRLAQIGCGLTDEECRLLKWTKWRTGMVLRFGNVTLLSLEELSGRLFSGQGAKMSIMKDGGRWEEHPLDTTVYGINVEVPDVFPLLRYAELHPRTLRLSRRSPRQVQERDDDDTRERSLNSSTNNPMREQPPPDGQGSRRRWTLSDRVNNIAKRVRSYTQAHFDYDPPLPSTKEEGATPSLLHDPSYIVLPDHNSDVSSSDSDNEKEGEKEDVERVRDVLRIEEVQSQFEELKRRRAQGQQRGVVWKTNLFTGASAGPPKLSEDNNDRMRAGLLSKVIDHITLLVEDWFSGVRPRFLVVPCPHCSHALPPHPVKLLRSHSINPDLRPSNVEAQQHTYPYSAHTQARLASTLTSQQTPSPNQRGRNRGRERAPMRVEEVPRDDVYYAFQYEECVVRAREIPFVECPVHGDLPLEYIAPDTLFLTEGRDVLLEPDDIIRKEKLGSGAYATVYHAQIKRRLPNGHIYYEDVAIKALGHKSDRNEGEVLSEEDPNEDEGHGGEREPAPIQRSAIISGFTNLKKELSILSPLRHPNIIEFYGISEKPLGLVLELAPKGSVKSKILKEYAEAQNHIQPPAIQAIIIQIANAVKYLHRLKIIYRDLKSDNVLVWKFPSPHVVLNPALPVTTDIVKVKLSDYGISQFVSTQGAKGLVGTPGFIAPEILKYHGKEAYNESVDIFSFAMFIYELITFRLPYEHLTPSQANQANENGARPTLKKKDLPCPVLVRELMVWCWQQGDKDRPEAGDIINVTDSDQFLRLSDAIRINNFGSQVFGSCYRIIKVSINKPVHTPALFTPSLTKSHFFSPQSSLRMSPFNKLQTISGPTSYATSEYSAPKSQTRFTEYGTGMSLEPKRSTHATMKSLYSTDVPTLGGASNDTIEVRAEATLDDAIPAPITKPRKISLNSEDQVSTPLSPDNDLTSPSSVGSSVHFKIHPHPRSEDNSGLESIGDDLSHPGPPVIPPRPVPPFLLMKEQDIYEEEEETDDEHHLVYQVWVASCSNHNSVATVVEYCGQFIKIEDIDLGDTPVLCIAMVRDKVWMGFEIGYLCIYDATTHDTLAQVWVHHGIPILSITYIPELRRVYIGLANGSVISFSDIIDPPIQDDVDEDTPTVITHLDPISTYKDSNEVCTVLLPVPSDYVDGETQYHLWVGQKNREITILDAKDLSAQDFVDSPLDKTICPSYLSQLPFVHLTCTATPTPVDSDNDEDDDITQTEPNSLNNGTVSEKVYVYGALKQGQYITCWDSNTKEMVECFDCLMLLPQWKDDTPPAISSLHYHNYNLYVGLVTGEILIIDAIAFSLLTTLHCHRSHVNSFLPIDLAKLLPHPSSPAYTPALSPSHPFLITDDNNVKYKTGPLQLMSFGTGFRAYYESADSIDYSKSSFLLVWEAADWGIDKGPR